MWWSHPKVAPSDLSRILIDSNSAGQPVYVSATIHTFCCGLSGSGKGSIQDTYYRELASFVDEGLCEFWSVDLKSGMEAGLVESLLARHAYTLNECEVMFADLLDEVKRRGKYAHDNGLRFLEPSKEFPRIYLSIDEAAELNASYGEAKKTSSRCLELLDSILRLGRAVSVVCNSYSQDPRLQSYPLRDRHQQTICLRVRSREEAKLVFGSDNAIKLGAAPWLISPQKPGTGFIYDSDDARVRRFRAEFMSDDDLRKLVIEHGEQVEAKGEPSDERSE